MAGGRDSSLESQHRLSLLDIVSERAKDLGKKALVHRLILIGKLNSNQSDRGQLGEHYEQFFKNHNGHGQVEAVTGLLLIYPQHFIHIIETSNSVLIDTIRDLDSKQQRGKLVCESKILSCLGNIPSRLYSQWGYRILTLPAFRTDESKLAEPIENLVSEALTMLLKLSFQLSKVPKLSLKTALDQLHEKHRALLVPSDVMNKLLATPDLCGPGQYLKTFCTPYDVTLDRDLVWPAETKLFPL